MAADTRLTREEKQRFADWLNVRGIKSCPMCDQRNWSIGDHLVAPSPITTGELPVEGISYPQAMLVCGSCTFTAYFNAVVVGLVRREPVAKE